MVTVLGQNQIIMFCLMAICRLWWLASLEIGVLLGKTVHMNPRGQTWKDQHSVRCVIFSGGGASWCQLTPIVSDGSRLYL